LIKRKIMRNVVITAILASLVLAGIVFWQLRPGQAQAQAAELAAAQARWAAQAPADYRLRLRYEVVSPLRNEQCGIEMEVRGEAIEILNNSCGPMRWTVERMFAAADLPTIRTCYPAGAGGCACMSSFQVQASFDAETGHPTEIRRQSMVSVQWLHSGFWQQFLREGELPWCVRSAGSSTRTLVVEEFAPLP
jgi:hypothetical protein